MRNQLSRRLLIAAALLVPVMVLSAGVTPANRSGTITTGGTAQVLMAANPARNGWSLMNVSAGDLWFYELGTATTSQPSIKVEAGALYESPAGAAPDGAISIIGATTGQAFAAREW